MENTMNTSEKIGQLAGALAKAQLEFKPVLKDSDNPYFNSKYADLATVIGATQTALAKNELVVIQSPVVDIEGERAGVTSVLAHSSGEWLSHECVLPATMKGKDGVLKFDSQSVGSAITYARRYSYQSIVGCAAEVDDDGNAASQNPREAGKMAAKSVATEKLREAAKGDENVILTPYKAGLVALSGNGLPIVRANIDNKVLGELGWIWEGKVAMIPVMSVDAFRLICKNHNVGTVFMDEPKPNEKSPLVKAQIPPFESFVEPQSASADPIIDSAERINPRKPGGKIFLSVFWNGKKASCWSKSLWPHLEHHVNRPAMLILETKGQYTNVVGIERLDGVNFQDEQNQTGSY